MSSALKHLRMRKCRGALRSSIRRLNIKRKPAKSLDEGPRASGWSRCRGCTYDIAVIRHVIRYIRGHRWEGWTLSVR
jgi:hypothetical protein